MDNIFTSGQRSADIPEAFLSQTRSGNVTVAVAVVVVDVASFGCVAMGAKNQEMNVHHPPPSSRSE